MEISHTTCAHTNDNNKSALIGLSATGMLFSAAMIGISLYVGIPLTASYSVSGGWIWFILLGIVYGIQFAGLISGMIGAVRQVPLAFLLLTIAEFLSLFGSAIFMGTMLSADVRTFFAPVILWISYNLNPFLWGIAITLGIQSRSQMLRIAMNPNANEGLVCGHTRDNNRTGIIVALSLILVISVPQHIFYWLSAGTTGQIGGALILSCLAALPLIATILGLVAAAANLSPKVRANMFLAFSVIGIIGLCVQDGFFAAAFAFSVAGGNSGNFIAILIFILLVLPMLLFLFSGARAVLGLQSRSYLVSNSGYVPLGDPAYAPQTYADSGTILPPYNTQYGNQAQYNQTQYNTQYGNPSQYHATGHNVGTNYTM